MQREKRDDHGRYALQASATFFGDVVEETFVDRGRPVQIGHSDAMALPVPEGWPFFAQVDWVDRRTVRVTDGEGRIHLVDPDAPLELAAGPVVLTLRVTQRYLLRRTEDFEWWGSTAWLTVVIAATLLVQQADVVWKHRCDWFGLDCPPVQVAGVSGAYTAEYLARLLEEDYAGADDGVVKPQERETGEKPNESFYLPAGSKGPVEDMGGAANTGDEVRAPIPDEEPIGGEPREFQLVAEETVGSPIEGSPEEVPEDDVPIADVAEDEGEAEDPLDPTEDREGWGVQDWYDTQDQALDDREIEMMLRISQERLRIDPDDPAALSILSYYQYLAEDYEAALKTYDRYISLYPEEPAGYNNKALVFKRQGLYEKEEGLYRVALALDPEDETALNNLAVCLAHQGRFNEALAIMERLEVIDPGDPYAELHRSKIHAQMGNDDLALHHLELALEGMAELDTLHHIEFRQDIRIDPSFEKLRQSRRFHAILVRYYGEDTPIPE